MQHETNFSCMKPVSLVPCVEDAKLMPEMLQNKGLRHLFVGMCFKISRTSLEAVRLFEALKRFVLMKLTAAQTPQAKVNSSCGLMCLSCSNQMYRHFANTFCRVTPCFLVGQMIASLSGKCASRFQDLFARLPL